MQQMARVSTNGIAKMGKMKIYQWKTMQRYISSWSGLADILENTNDTGNGGKWSGRKQ